MKRQGRERRKFDQRTDDPEEFKRPRDENLRRGSQSHKSGDHLKEEIKTREDGYGEGNTLNRPGSSTYRPDRDRSKPLVDEFGPQDRVDEETSQLRW